MPNTPHTAPAPGLPNATPLLLLEQTLALLSQNYTDNLPKTYSNHEKYKQIDLRRSSGTSR
jgi:hypothetical protein